MIRSKNILILAEKQNIEKVKEAHSLEHLIIKEKLLTILSDIETGVELNENKSK